MLQQARSLGRWCFRRLASSLVVLTLGCGGAELRERTVDDVTLRESSPSDLDTDEALEGLATAAPRTFLSVVTARDPYDANLVARDLERIERFYRSHGFYDAKVVAARVRALDEKRVEIEIHVTPGPRVVVRSFKDDLRILSLPGDVQLKLNALPKLQRGTPFEEQALDQQKRAIETLLREEGYAYAQVRVTASVDLNARAADITREIEAGKRCHFGAIRISGLVKIPEGKVRPALDLKTGDQFSQHDLDDARDAVSNMQLFSRVEVTPDLSNPEVEAVPINVTVQEDKLRKITLGGGTVVDSLKLEAHIKTGWEHKNFLGGARRFSIDGAIGLDFFPTRFETFDTLTTWTNTFLVTQATATLEQPSIFGGRTKGSLQAGVTRRPMLYPLPEGADPTAEVVIGYYTPSTKVALSRSFLRQHLFVEPSYNLEARMPFAYQNEIPAELETVWVSYPRLYFLVQSFPGDIFQDRGKRDLTLSFRTAIEVAGLDVSGTRVFGGSLSDIKIEPEVRALLPLWGKRWRDGQKVGNLVLGTRVKYGMIARPDYGSSLQDEQVDFTDPAVQSDQQKLLTRAFYSGGPNSNRGYAYRAISPHGPVGFLVPTDVNCVLNATDPRCIRPLGGFTLWEASLELRWAGFHPLTLIAFADAADVGREVGQITFKYPHVSVGPGLRYETPVGPIRLDIGIRVPGLQAIGQDELPLSHGEERPNTFGLPMAIQVAFGEAF